MNEDDARKIAKAFFDEQEEREKRKTEQKEEKEKRKKSIGYFYTFLYTVILLGGGYLIWKALAPIINMANWGW
jgi:cytoskeletal protein RodZ